MLSLALLTTTSTFGLDAIAQEFPATTMPNTESTPSNLDAEIDRYTYRDSNDVLKFDIAAAQENHASETAIRSGEYINGFSSGSQSRSLDSVMNKWRYCRPNNSQPGPPQVGKPADEAGMNHDICLRNAADNEAKKGCDQALVEATQRELDSNSGAYSWDEIAYLHAMKRAIGWAKDHCRVDNPPSVCSGKLI